MTTIAMPQDQTTISNIIDYPLNGDGKLVTRRGGLTRLKPRLEAPLANQPGSVHWTMLMLFGSTDKAIQMIESLVAGQGDNADEKWIRFVLLYRQWQLQHNKGELPEAPTFNQVCYSLGFDSKDFVTQLQIGIQSLMVSIAHMKAQLVVPDVIDNLNSKARSADADTKEIELQLKVAGVLDEKGGVNINVTQQQGIMLKGEKDKMKAPLLQFNETVIEIDNEVRREHDQDN